MRKGMEVECVDVGIPRIDGQGQCTGLTVGKRYPVVGTYRWMVRIINDEGKKASYLRIRLKVVP